MSNKTIHDADAVLLYKVGPVICCSPSLPVEAVIMPPNLTHPPGTTDAEPGMFKSAYGIVKAVDLRKRFGVDREDWQSPGRVIIIEVEGGHAGLWVDEIIDVIQFPEKGWGRVPSCIPRDVFTKTLLLDNKIWLYADFENIYNFRETGYLRQHIQTLKEEIKKQEELQQQEKVTGQIKADKPVDADIKKSFEENKQAPQTHHDVHEMEKISAEKVDQETSLKKESVTHLKETGNVASKRELQKPEVLVQASKQSTHQTIDKKVADVMQSSFDSFKEIKPVTDGFESRTDKRESQETTAYHKERQTTVSAESPAKGRDLVENKNVKKKESSSLIIVAIFLLPLLIGGYLLYLLAPKSKIDPNASLTKENGTEIKDEDYLVEKKSKVNEIDDTYKDESEKIETEKVEIEEVAPVEKLELMETVQDIDAVERKTEESLLQVEDYSADITEDEEGLVIVLTQPEDETETVFKDDAPEENDQDIDLIEEKMEKVLQQSIQKEVSEEVVIQEEVKPVKIEKPEHKKVQKQDVIIHIVVKGDTLWHIAKRYINNPYRYPELAKLSRIKNPDLIYPGDKVKIIINKQAR